jgi:periplasmic protein TonB
LSFVVDVDGRTKNIVLLKPLGAGLDEEAIKAVHKWRFTPGEKDGQPVPVQVKAEINFHLYKR